jgi:hypothetical protein
MKFANICGGIRRPPCRRRLARHKRYAIVYLGGIVPAQPTLRRDGTMGTCTQNLKRRLTRRSGVTRCQRGSGRTVTCCCCGCDGTNAARPPKRRRAPRGLRKNGIRAHDLREFIAIGDVEFDASAVDMALDRTDGHGELVGDLAIGQAGGDQPGDLPLAG